MIRSENKKEFHPPIKVLTYNKLKDNILFQIHGSF